MARIMIAMALISMLAVTAHAYRPSTHTVSGLVMDGNGKPVAEAKVEFWLLTSYQRWFRVTGSTDSAGKYAITGVPESKGIGMAWGPEHGRGPVEQQVEVKKGSNIYHFEL